MPLSGVTPYKAQMWARLDELGGGCILAFFLPREEASRPNLGCFTTFSPSLTKVDEEVLETQGDLGDIASEGRPGDLGPGQVCPEHLVDLLLGRPVAYALIATKARHGEGGRTPTVELRAEDRKGAKLTRTLPGPLP